jgi:hypothetical protein
MAPLPSPPTLVLGHNGWLDTQARAPHAPYASRRELAARTLYACWTSPCFQRTSHHVTNTWCHWSWPWTAMLVWPKPPAPSDE